MTASGRPDPPEGEGPQKFPATGPCNLCTGDSACWVGKMGTPERRLMTSEEWCREVDTCAATIDWDKVFGHG